jgi:hypothetical protein
MASKSLKSAGVAVIVLALAAFASSAIADVNPVWNTQTGSSFPTFTLGTPSWLTGAAVNQAAHLTAPMTGAFAGTVDSWVYFLNGTDSSAGLGFVYKFAVTNYASGNGVVRASFDSDPAWAASSVTSMGSDSSGTSTQRGPVGKGWTNGDPSAIILDATYFSPEIQFNSNGIGTILNKPTNTSALIWFATDATSFKTSFTGLQDTGKVGYADVLIVPAPAAVVLGMMCLGMVGWLKRRLG